MNYQEPHEEISRKQFLIIFTEKANTCAAVLSHKLSELISVDENHTSPIRQNFEAYHKALGDTVIHFPADFDILWLNQRSVYSYNPS